MDQVVSDFIVSTTLVDARPNVNKFADWTFRSTFKQPCHTAGSISELYIEPPLPCVADIDLVPFDNDRVAVQSASQMPLRLNLPSTYADIVEVYEIVASQYPGYVTLEKIGELRKQLKGTYQFTQSIKMVYSVLMDDRDEGMKAANVARLLVDEKHRMINGCYVSVEYVQYIRCLSWPQQANRWSTRQRKYNWPHGATVEFIVSKGCDFVQIAHSQCQHDERVRDTQRRMSFSRAETVLLNSWTPIQQVVYHMLRTVLKIQGLTDKRDSSGGRIVSRYHVKTLMLWFCELKDPAWWTRFNLVVLSSKCLRVLCKCCVAGHCPGYFITDHNLFECEVQSVCLSEICEQMSLLTDVVYLTNWFLHSYVNQCTREYPSLFNDMNAEGKLTPAVVNDYQKSLRSKRLMRYNLAQALFVDYFNVKSRAALTDLRQLLDVDHNMSYYFVSCVCLHLCTKLNETNWFDVMNYVAKLMHYSSRLTDSCDVMSTQFDSLIETAMSLVIHILVSLDEPGGNCSATNLIKLSLPRNYLYRALMVSHKASEDSEQCVARVYMAVLYYIAGQFQNAVKQCTKASSLNCRSHVIEGQLLPKFDDDVDSVLGLVVLYYYVQTIALSLQRQQSGGSVYSVFSIKMFLRFVQFKSCLRDPTLHKQRYPDLTERPVKPCNASDLLLYFIVVNNSSNGMRQFSCVDLPKGVSMDFTVSEARLLLVLSGLQQLTMHHQLMAREFSSVGLHVATTDIQALCDFNMGLYERCFRLSQQNAYNLWPQTVHLQVNLSRCMSTILDDDLASVVGLIYAFINPANAVSVFQLTLSLYLSVQCRIKLKHFATRSLIFELRVVRLLHDRYYHVEKISCDRLLLNFAYSRLVTEIRTRQVADSL